MTHWGWYWNVKNKNVPRRRLCSYSSLCEIDSFKMFNNYQLVELVRESSDKCSLYIPEYDLKAYLQDDDSLLVKYKDGFYVIPVEKKPCNFGGYYYFFHCPLCDRRMRKLYCLAGLYRCRKCENLAYYTQRLRSAERFTIMYLKIEGYIKNRGGALKLGCSYFELDKKPPRMHRRTFQKLKDRVKYYDAKSGQALFEDARTWYGPKAERWLDGYFEYEWKCEISEYENKYMKKK